MSRKSKKTNKECLGCEAKMREDRMKMVNSVMEKSEGGMGTDIRSWREEFDTRRLVLV